MNLRKLLRYKIGLLNTAPNILLNVKQIYNDCPLKVQNYNNVNTFKYNLIGQVLCLMNSLGLSISSSYHLKESFKIEPGNVPLIDVLEIIIKIILQVLKRKI